MKVMLKEGVKLSGVDADFLVNTISTLSAIFEFSLKKSQFTITSGLDGVHKKGSLHPKGLAFDIRTKTLTNKEKDLLVAHVSEDLGESYDVLIEARGKANEHLHIEYDPT